MIWDLRHKIEIEVIRLCDEVNAPKAKAYAGDGDTFANFKNGGGIRLTKYQVWAILFHKHIDAIFNAIIADPLRPVEKTESLLGRIIDAINYLRILAGMLYEDGLINLFGKKNGRKAA
jgi:hypothetical protein